MAAILSRGDELNTHDPDNPQLAFEWGTTGDLQLVRSLLDVHLYKQITEKVWKDYKHKTCKLCKNLRIYNVQNKLCPVLSADAPFCFINSLSPGRF